MVTQSRTAPVERSGSPASARVITPAPQTQRSALDWLDLLNGPTITPEPTPATPVVPAGEPEPRRTKGPWLTLDGTPTAQVDRLRGAGRLAASVGRAVSGATAALDTASERFSDAWQDFTGALDLADATLTAHRRQYDGPGLAAHARTTYRHAAPGSQLRARARHWLAQALAMLNRLRSTSPGPHRPTARPSITARAHPRGPRL